jgi:hypothetical protein
MRRRVDRFTDAYLKPILASDNPELDSEKSVVVVAHGLVLSVILRSILSVFSPTELTRLSGEVDPRRRDHLAQWSNTGYLEALVRRDDSTSKVSVLVTAINCVDHLKGFKKTKGGIGSSTFDEKQRTMDSFLRPQTKRSHEDGDHNY